jgi:hypothetical protein
LELVGGGEVGVERETKGRGVKRKKGLEKRRDSDRANSKRKE